MDPLVPDSAVTPEDECTTEQRRKRESVAALVDISNSSHLQRTIHLPERPRLQEASQRLQDQAYASRATESRLLTLPGELRNRIYDYVFTKDAVVHSHMKTDRLRTGGRELADPEYRDRKSKGPEIHTCRIIREEASQLYYWRTTFVFHNADAITTFFSGTPSHCQAYIRSIRLAIAAGRVYQQQRPYTDTAREHIRDRRIHELRNAEDFEKRHFFCEGPVPLMIPWKSMPQLLREMVDNEAELLWRPISRPLRAMADALQAAGLFANTPQLKYVALDFYPQQANWPLHVSFTAWLAATVTVLDRTMWFSAKRKLMARVFTERQCLARVRPATRTMAGADVEISCLCSETCPGCWSMIEEDDGSFRVEWGEDESRLGTAG